MVRTKDNSGERSPICARNHPWTRMLHTRRYNELDHRSPVRTSTTTCTTASSRTRAVYPCAGTFSAFTCSSTAAGAFAAFTGSAAFAGALTPFTYSTAET
jgi:hypothetical protein